MLIDYGGVIADEGFSLGLRAIARQQGREPDAFFALANEIVYSCGYVTGQAAEHDFWREVRRQSGIVGDDDTLTREILDRFTPRPEMLEYVRRLRNKGITVCLLSDQSDWLDRLNQIHHFFSRFDQVFNSFHLGKTKRDISLFTEVLAALRQTPANILFVDDNSGHIGRAGRCGLATHHFTDPASFAAWLRNKKIL
jgi:putative hydrolase of the HAD superfamily